MYKLGYELCEDNVREVFRIATGHSTDTISWPNIAPRRYCLNTVVSSTPPTTETLWMRCIGLLRHLTDATLDLLILHHHHQQQEQQQQIQIQSDHHNTKSPQLMRIQNRPYSGAASWWENVNFHQIHSIQPRMQQQLDRNGDYSVLYAMHYFNDGKSMVQPGVAVKEHVDPSLLVVEPFLCTTTTGLQVGDRRSTKSGSWIDCDGPNSPMYPTIMEAQYNNEEIMLLFVGKALSEAIPSIPPTLHRVVTGQQPRRTIIYEQKYAEFYPTPTFD
jgi:hypothetical protein